MKLPRLLVIGSLAASLALLGAGCGRRSPAPSAENTADAATVTQKNANERRGSEQSTNSPPTSSSDLGSPQLGFHLIMPFASPHEKCEIPGRNSWNKDTDGLLVGTNELSGLNKKLNVLIRAKATVKKDARRLEEIASDLDVPTEGTPTKSKNGLEIMTGSTEVKKRDNDQYSANTWAVIKSLDTSYVMTAWLEGASLADVTDEIAQWDSIIDSFEALPLKQESTVAQQQSIPTETRRFQIDGAEATITVPTKWIAQAKNPRPVAAKADDTATFGDPSWNFSFPQLVVAAYRRDPGLSRGLNSEEKKEFGITDDFIRTSINGEESWRSRAPLTCKMYGNHFGLNESVAIVKTDHVYVFKLDWEVDNLDMVDAFAKLWEQILSSFEAAS